MSSATLAIVTLLAVATIAGLVLWLLRPRWPADFRRADNTPIFHAGAGHAFVHDGGFTPSCDNGGGFCGDGGGATLF